MYFMTQCGMKMCRYGNPGQCIALLDWAVGHHLEKQKASSLDNKKQGVTALLFDNLTGIEVFFLLVLGQLGQLIASGKPVAGRIVLSNALLNIVITTIIIQVGEWREWGAPQVLIVGGVVGVVGVNATIAFIKSYMKKT